MINTLSESLYRLDILNRMQDRLTYQSSSKRKIDNGSDDSFVFTRQIYLEDKISRYEGLKSQIEITSSQNDTADTAVGSIKDKITLLKNEISKALNGTEQETSRETIAINVAGIKKSLLLFANERSNGEYLFAGTDSSKPPFEQDPVTGEVTYTGSGYLKRLAIDEGSYSQRGVSGFDLMMNTTQKALFGEKLTFTEGQRVIDNQGNEWTFDSSVPELVKNNENGPTNEKMPLTEVLPSTTPKTYETTNPISTQGQTLSAKENIFDIVDDIMNALNQVDDTGASITKDEADAILKAGLSKVNKAFDTVNKAHSDLGVRNKTFEVAHEKVSSKLTHYNILFTETAGADLAKVAMESKALELTYTSLYSTINKMNQLSLVNFIN
ncbi:flagellar hook-associated protein 3 [Malaciobacter molluscorum]|uniref:flagellar hook-associated protein FlgL n=1 Tax=Malaciobacter molluscorum TaxID=1032072 RepID=UPI00100B9D4B|nr:flagellar hook-associated protein FlgL [Malaciobacter molluscorum]RXJ95582.1 flagellar hook-associated protein 3 [Malaciobacter molluscorum]